MLRSLLAWLFAMVCLSAWAGDGAESVLADLDASGYPSPVLALQRLQARPAAPTAPLELQRRYHAALARHATKAGQPAVAATALAELRRMSEQHACEPCALSVQLLEQQQAEHARDLESLKQGLARLQTVPLPADPELHFWMLATQASGRDLLGDYEAAIQHAVQAGQVAAKAQRSADRVHAYHLLVRSNAGRRDLHRSIVLAQEGYALAKSIGFGYMMVLLRANEAYARATLKQTEPRRLALVDTLKLTRATPGLEKHELTTLINLAAYHYDVGQYEAAARYARQAEVAAERDSDPNSKAFAIGNHGAALVRLGQVERGLAMLREGVAITERTGLKLEMVDLMVLMVDALEAAGRPQQALQTLRRVVKLNEDLTRTEREEALQGLQERFSDEQKAREIERLQLLSQRHEAELAARTLEQRLWAAVAVALTFGALLLAQWLRTTRQRLRRLKRDNDKLSDQSVHDPMTGAFNRRYCEQWLQHHRPVAEGQPDSVGLLLVDVDHFKLINDTHGHPAGDAVLVELARRLQALLRDQDVVVRWGGEEFLLMLPGTPNEALPAIAERVLKAVGEMPVVLSPSLQMKVRVSAGAVAWPMAPGQTWEAALALADQALYLSKAEGRNRATCVLPRQAGLAVLNDLRWARAAGAVACPQVAGPPVAAEEPVRGAEPSAETIAVV